MALQLDNGEFWQLLGLSSDYSFLSSAGSAQSILQRHAELPQSAGTVSTEWLVLPDGMTIGLFNLNLHEPLRIVRCHPVDRVLLNITIAGTAVTRLEDAPGEWVDRKGSVCLVAPHGRRTREVEFAETGENRIVQIVMPQLDVQKLIQDFALHMTPWQQHRLAAGGGSVIDRRCIPPQMALAIDQIFHTRLDPSARPLYLRGKALEIIALFATCGKVSDHCRREPKMQAAVADRLNRARQLMLADLAAAPPIAELARRVRLGESTLTHGFRACFGKSVHEFLMEHRLERARELICKESWRHLSDIAYEVGFKCPSRFAAVFAQHFGVLPRVYRASFRGER